MNNRERGITEDSKTKRKPSGRQTKAATISPPYTINLLQPLNNKHLPPYNLPPKQNPSNLFRADKNDLYNANPY